MNYWKNREERAKHARKHSEEMEERFSEEISRCVADTKIYFRPDFETEIESGVKILEEKTGIIKKKHPEIFVKNVDSVTAIMDCDNTSRLAVLNFASYKNPGGKFLEGSSAQEESLCHSSILYNVLSRFPGYYHWNNQNKNCALYKNRALFSPNVLFIRDSAVKQVDVITCAAPNKTTAQRYQNISDDRVSKELDSRIKFVLDLAREEEVETLILGAFGCGVFGNDAREVALLFKKHLLSGRYGFKQIIFAVPGNDYNFRTFNAVFKKK